MKINSLKFKGAMPIILSAIILLSGCNASRTVKGGAIGAGAGGVIGGLIGSKSDNTAKGAILGAAIGGAAGALIGHYMDKQAKELQEDLKGAKVERIGEGIKITFDSGILFNVSSDALSGASKQNITDLAKTLQKYEDTNILIEGHTDSSGSDEFNQKLSEERAASVASELKKQGVASARISEVGYGETMPIADNTTEAGKKQNRRVEIAIFANKKLQKAAERGDLD